MENYLNKEFYWCVMLDFSQLLFTRTTFSFYLTGKHYLLSFVFPLSFLFFSFFCFLLMRFFKKLKMYILIHIQVCGQVSYKESETRLFFLASGLYIVPKFSSKQFIKWVYLAPCNSFRLCKYIQALLQSINAIWLWSIYKHYREV